ncbi:MAG: hypothetical protein FGM24_08060 [Candidatus Kapabacteria bacterium]|nr:hypothetical protein [Candidatus Kapabacteria bacterium]
MHSMLRNNDVLRPFRPIAVILLALLLGACGAVQPVRVLPKGETLMTASLGGAVGVSTSPVGFVPYAIVGAAHGVSDDITIHGNIHALMAVFGVVGLDAGASYRVMHQHDWIPEVTAAARGIFFSKPNDSYGAMRLYPDVSATLSWELGQRRIGYVGTHATTQLSNGQMFFSPMVGLVAAVNDAWSVQLETIWQAANINTQKGIFEGESSIGGNGSLGVYIGAQVKL